MRTHCLEALFALQCFHVLFLALHDYVPLGRLNDVRAVRQANTPGQLLWDTAWVTGIFLYVTVETLRHLRGPLPSGLTLALSLLYGFLFLGELRAWWLPYLRGTREARVVRYRSMFGATHSFLPERHGITPNTLHVVLHLATLATLVVLAVAVHIGAAHF